MTAAIMTFLSPIPVHVVKQLVDLQSVAPFMLPWVKLGLCS